MPFTLIGDIVGSRRLDDREHAQVVVNTALEAVNRTVAPLQRLSPSVGDEFQGTYAELWQAVTASLLIRLELTGGIDVRCGLGEGEVAVIDRRRHHPPQDGPGWWSARAALDELDKPSRKHSRTWFQGLGSSHVNAYLLVRDAMVFRMSDRHQRVLRLAIDGATQAEIAEAEGITQSAVSQAFTTGVRSLRDSVLTFRGGD